MDRPVLRTKGNQMTKEQYWELQQEGEKLFRSILVDLNKVSEEHIHDTVSTEGTYRRRCDFNEICVALALYKSKQEGVK